MKNIGVLILCTQIFFIFQAHANIPKQSREMQVISLKGYRIAIDNDPAWNWKLKYNKEVPVFVASSPQNYYPPAIVNVRYHSNILVKDTAAKLKAVSRSAIKESLKYYVKEKININDSLKKVTYKQLKGYEFNTVGIIQGQKQDIKIVIARNEHGKIISFFAYTQTNKMNHIQPAVDRILNSVSFLRKF